MTAEDIPKVEPCRWCGVGHGPLCPYVKALEFKDEMGNPDRVTRVEFITPNDIPPEIRKQQ